MVTANQRAAACYRQAQRAVDLRRAIAALRRAVSADPAFGLALADLDAITGTAGRWPARQSSSPGGTAGIGRAAALGLAAMGAHLAIAGRDRPRADGVAREINAVGGGNVDVFVADLSSQPEVRRLADQVLQRLSRIDVLINNAGGYRNTRPRAPPRQSIWPPLPG